MDDHRLLEEASEELADEPSTAAGLRATAEQLQVVEEELHQQNEELAAAREALEAERNRYQELFECAPDGYLITDPEGMIGEANRAAAVLLGMEPGLLVGKPLANCLPKEECRAFRTKLSQLRHASRLQVWGVSLQPCRGAPFDAALTVATVRDAEQRLQGLRWLIRDISDQKLAEDQIRSLNATLEERVRERTAQLEEAHRAREELLVQEQAACAEAEAAQRRLAFLSEASSMLASSLDYETTLDQVARLVVPHLGDWCIVDMVEGDGSFRVLAMTHVDPAKEGLVRELRRRYPPDLNEPHGLGTVLRTGQPEVVAAVSDALLEAIACDAEHARLLRELGCQSLIRVPLQARGQPFGVLSLGSEQPGGRCGPDDLALAEELARRAALAVDNARLYHEAQTEITERKRAEEALRVRASQRAAIVELGQCALEGTDLSALMDQAAVLVAQILGPRRRGRKAKSASAC